MSRYFSPSLRRRLAPLVLVLGALLIGDLAYQNVPREQSVHYLLSPEQQRAVRSVRITYTEDGEALGGVERHFPASGAPAEFTHAPSLRSGRYDITVELTDRDGHVERVARVLELPGAPRIRLGSPP